MKQNFLLKSFVLLIALLAGGISAWADPTYHNFMSSGVTILSDSYVATWSNSSTSGYWMLWYHFAKEYSKKALPLYNE